MSAAKSRLVWFDANRVLAAVGVVIIHATTDFAGQPFAAADPDQRIIPVLLRTLGEFSGSEMFFMFSLFLMAMRIDRKLPEYGPTIKQQARRLLVPFAFWVVFYAFFRLMKADTFGYAPYIMDQLASPQAWLGYFVLGSSQYHMHFLPTLFVLFLFYPVMRLGIRYPILGLTVVLTLGVMNHAQAFVWGLGLEPELRSYIIRAIKILGYVGYGFAAFAIYGLWSEGIPRGESRLIRRGALYFMALAYLATAPFYWHAITEGSWGIRQDWTFYGHFLMPIFVFLCFIGSQYLNWSERFVYYARFSFGVYLVHPLVIDLFDVTVFRFGLADLMSPAALVVSRILFTIPAAFALSVALSKTFVTAWTIGLGPAPWEWRKQTGAAGA